MAATAFQTKYLDEWIAGYERDKTTLRQTVTTEAMIQGQSAVFLVATSGSEAVTRGGNGLIPATPLSQTQNTVTLTEKHSLKQMTGFNIFAAQANVREIMQRATRTEINRGIDNRIITILATGSVTPTATAGIMTKQLVTQATTQLWNGYVNNDGNVWGLLTPAAWGHLSDIPEFASADFMTAMPLESGAPTMGAGVKKWMGVNWLMHTGLTNSGLATAKCFIYHKSAVGYACNSGDIKADAAYMSEQDYSWARATVYDGALKLQNAGIVVINHDDTQYS